MALVDPLDSMGHFLGGEISMGLCATPIMDRALRVISVLAADPENLDLIQRIASAAIDSVERPAPALKEPDEESESEEDGEE